MPNVSFGRLSPSLTLLSLFSWSTTHSPCLYGVWTTRWCSGEEVPYTLLMYIFMDIPTLPCTEGNQTLGTRKESVYIIGRNACERTKNRCKPPSAALYRSPGTPFPGANFCCNTPKGVYVSPCLGVWLVHQSPGYTKESTAQMPQQRHTVTEAFLSSASSHTHTYTHLHTLTHTLRQPHANKKDDRQTDRQTDGQLQ